MILRKFILFFKYYISAAKKTKNFNFKFIYIFKNLIYKLIGNEYNKHSR